MAKQDTSQNAICKNSLLKVQDITRQVNESASKIRLQAAKLFLDPHGKEILVLDFYPHFNDLAWFWEAGALCALSLTHLNRAQLKAFKTPYLLYLKAHFVGHRLSKLQENDEKLCFEFEDGRSFHWNLPTKEFEFKVPGRKVYLQRLPLWGQMSELVQSAESVEEASAVSPEAPASPRTKQLRENIEGDKIEAEQWIEKNKKFIEEIFSSPQLWGSDLNLQAVSFQEWAKEISPKISWATPRKLALEKLKKLLNRYERKLEKSTQRLQQLSTGKLTARNVVHSSKIQSEDKASTSKIGKRVLLQEGLEAYVGKTAIENDELYRKAASRDLWFHVRGHKGAHVWIRRGQAKFGAKDELSPENLERGALLAAKFSKASGSWIAVDYTERRFLKKLKGSPPGAVQVLQSKTLFVSLGE